VGYNFLSQTLWVYHSFSRRCFQNREIMRNSD